MAIIKTPSHVTLKNKKDRRSGEDTAITFPQLLLTELMLIFDGAKKKAHLLLHLIDGSPQLQLRNAFLHCLVTTLYFVNELDSILEAVGTRGTQAASALPTKPNESKAFDGLMEEAKKHIKKSESTECQGHILVSDLQKILHVEMASLGAAAAHAGILNQRRIYTLMREAVEQTKRIDQQLTDLLHRGNHDCRGGGFMSRADLRSSPFLRSTKMPNYSRYRDDDDDRRTYNDGGGRSGRATTQERDEYGQFTSRQSSGSRYEDEDRDGSRRSGGGGGSGSRYDEDDRMTGRRSRYEDDDRDYSSRLDIYDDDSFGGNEGRSRGGQHSADMQERDEYGRFAGSSGGRSRYVDDDNRGGRSSYSSSGRSRYNDDGRDDRWSNASGGRTRRGDEYSDSAGRRYSRESWERAQEGRSIGGQHSHGGGRSRDDDYDNRRGYHQYSSGSR